VPNLPSSPRQARWLSDAAGEAESGIESLDALASTFYGTFNSVRETVAAILPFRGMLPSCLGADKQEKVGKCVAIYDTSTLTITVCLQKVQHNNPRRDTKNLALTLNSMLETQRSSPPSYSGEAEAPLRFVLRRSLALCRK
jgi:hypothetical protein